MFILFIFSITIFNVSHSNDILMNTGNVLVKQGASVFFLNIILILDQFAKKLTLFAIKIVRLYSYILLFCKPRVQI